MLFSQHCKFTKGKHDQTCFIQIEYVISYCIRLRIYCVDWNITFAKKEKNKKKIMDIAMCRIPLSDSCPVVWL